MHHNLVLEWIAEKKNPELLIERLRNILHYAQNKSKITFGLMYDLFVISLAQLMHASQG